MKKTLFYIVSISCFASCTSGTPEETTNDCLTETVSFKADVMPIFEQNCVSCHNEEDYASKADGNKMYTYEHIKGKLDEGLVLGNIKHEQGFIKMPHRKKQLAECDIAIIEQWVNNGALND